MSMLAERRRKTKWVINPTKKPLWNSDSKGINLGKELMEKMGWAPGKGLGLQEQGIQEPLKVSYKNDTKGMGFKGNDEDWIEHQDEFNSLLSQLSSSVDETIVKTEGLKKDKIESLEEKSRQSKVRVHYQKFTRGKDLSQYSENDLACILGKSKKKEEKKMAEELKEKEENSKKEKNDGLKTSFGVTTINGGSLENYFKKKWVFQKSKQNQPDVSENQNGGGDDINSEQVENDILLEGKNISNEEKEVNNEAYLNKKSKKKVKNVPELVINQIEDCVSDINLEDSVNASVNFEVSDKDEIVMKKKKKKHSKKDISDVPELVNNIAEDCISDKNLEDNVNASVNFEMNDKYESVQKKKKKKHSMEDILDESELVISKNDDCISDINLENSVKVGVNFEVNDKSESVKKKKKKKHSKEAITQNKELEVSETDTQCPIDLKCTDENLKKVKKKEKKFDVKMTDHNQNENTTETSTFIENEILCVSENHLNENLNTDFRKKHKIKKQEGEEHKRKKRKITDIVVVDVTDNENENNEVIFCGDHKCNEKLKDKSKRTHTQEDNSNDNNEQTVKIKKCDRKKKKNKCVENLNDDAQCDKSCEEEICVVQIDNELMEKARNVEDEIQEILVIDECSEKIKKQRKRKHSEVVDCDEAEVQIELQLQNNISDERKTFKRKKEKIKNSNEITDSSQIEESIQVLKAKEIDTNVLQCKEKKKKHKNQKENIESDENLNIQKIKRKKNLGDEVLHSSVDFSPNECVTDCTEVLSTSVPLPSSIDQGKKIKAKNKLKKKESDVERTDKSYCETHEDSSFETEQLKNVADNSVEENQNNEVSQVEEKGKQCKVRLLQAKNQLLKSRFWCYDVLENILGAKIKKFKGSNLGDVVGYGVRRENEKSSI